MHILFFRSARLPDLVFSPDLFNRRYLRDASLALLEQPVANDDNNDINLPTNNVVDDVLEQEQDFVLNDKQKYSMVMPILLRIGNMISSHSTKNFLHYLDSLNELEKKVRRGQNVLPLIENIIPDLENCDVGNVGSEISNVDPESVQEETVQEILEAGSVHPPSSLSGQGRFADIAFKESLRTKGRPKKRSRQFVFNTGKADRIGKKSKKKDSLSAKAKQNITRKKVNYISASDTDSCDEESLGLYDTDSDNFENKTMEGVNQEN